MSILICVEFLFLLLCVLGSAQQTSNPQCFDPKSVSTLTFYKGAMTTSARAPPIAQLSCVGGNGCQYASQISSVQCQNEGSNEYGDVQWSCTASLPRNVEFGAVTVSCEGCQSSIDSQKLTGSCGLMFQLDLVSSGDYGSSGIIATLIWWFVVAVICYFCCCCWCRNSHHHHHDRYGYVEISSTPAVPVTYTTPVYNQGPPLYPFPSAPVPSAPPVVIVEGNGYNNGMNNLNSFAAGMAVESILDNNKGYHHHHGGGGGGGGHHGHHQSTGFGGSARSTSQTDFPTSRPTRLPTSSYPSQFPSCYPSSQPTLEPSAQPTMQPTSSPSSQPSCLPTYPSSRPSSSPTNPTSHPSSYPSCFPTKAPSSHPSSSPSGRPTSPPSTQPSTQPTSQPIVSPTSYPSNFPSSHPSRYPSSQPSSKPTCLPTMIPLSRPSSYPTSSPTAQPSSSPSQRPSSVPTRRPSGRPSSRPSLCPSFIPTSVPTQRPLSNPTLKPTCSPRALPSTVPTAAPTSRPSRIPSRQPSSQPTKQPISAPTWQPSAQPISRPTRQPTRCPSSQPSVTPTRQPTCQPSPRPSAQPSAVPTARPSIAPSSIPSAHPWSQPTAVPTKEPTSRPSESYIRLPTSVPTETTLPSSQPSPQTTKALPTGYPTGIPSNSRNQIEPSKAPTLPPTLQPNQLHSYAPTLSPNNAFTHYLYIQRNMYSSDERVLLYNQVSSSGSSVNCYDWSSFVYSLYRKSITSQLKSITFTSFSSQNYSFSNSSYICQDSNNIAELLKRFIGRNISSISFECNGVSWHANYCNSLFRACVNCSDPCKTPTTNYLHPCDQAITTIESINSAIFSFANVIAPQLEILIFPADTFIRTQIKLSLAGYVQCAVSRVAEVPGDVSLLIAAQGIVGKSPTGLEVIELTIANLLPLQRYVLYCSSRTLAGVSMNSSSILKAATAFNTTCCKQFIVRLSSLAIVANQTYVDLIYQGISDLPAHGQLISRISVQRVSPSSYYVNSSKVFPSRMTYTVRTSIKSYTSHIAGFTEGTYRVSIDLLGSAADEYNISYPNGQIFIVYSGSSAGGNSNTQFPGISRASFDSSGSNLVVELGSPLLGIPLKPRFICSEVISFIDAENCACKWLVDNRTIIASAAKSAVEPGQVLSLKQQFIMTSIRASRKYNSSLWNSSAISSAIYSAIITVDNATIVSPVVRITMPDVVGTCDAIDFDVTQSTGNAGRAWKHRSIEVVCSNQNCSSLKKYLNGANFDGPFPISLNASLFTVNVEYSFLVKLCNFFGLCGYSTKTVEVMSRPVDISVLIVGSVTRTIHRNSTLILLATGQASRCDQSSVLPTVITEEMTFNWTIYPSLLKPTRISFGNELMIPSFAVEKTTVYTIKVAGYHVASGSIATYSVTLQVAVGELVPILTCGSKLFIRSGEIITIDASSSYDTDVDHQSSLESAGSVLDFTWSCAQIFPQLNSMCPITISGTSTAKITAAKNSDNSTSVLSLILSDSQANLPRAASISTVIHVIEAHVPVLSLQTTTRSNGLQLSSINANVDIAINCSIRISLDAYATSSLGLFWALTPSIEDTKPSSASAGRMYLPTSNISPTSRDLTFWVPLYIRSNLLASDIEYTFSLTAAVNYSTSALILKRHRTAIDDIAIVLNQPPAPGQLVVSPSKGIAYKDQFKLAALYWIDLDLPLQYQFGYLSGNKGLFVALASTSASSFAKTQLPIADHDKLSCQVVVYDTYWANSSMSIDVNVIRPSAISLIATTAFPEYLSLLSSGGFVNKLNTIGSFKQYTSLYVSALRDNVTCSSAIVNCSALFRQTCSRLPNICGDCIRGYFGDSNQNSPCISPSSSYPALLSAWRSSMNVIRTGPPLKVCPNNCSGHGHCIACDSSIGNTLIGQLCYVDDSKCLALCLCEAEWYGPDCSRSVAFDRDLRVSAIENATEHVFQLAAAEFETAESIANWISLVSFIDGINQHALSMVSIRNLYQLIDRILVKSSESNLPVAHLEPLLDVIDCLANVDILLISYRAHFLSKIESVSYAEDDRVSRKLDDGSSAAAQSAHLSCNDFIVKNGLLVDSISKFAYTSMNLLGKMNSEQGSFVPYSAIKPAFRVAVATLPSSSSLSSSSSWSVAVPQSSLEIVTNVVPTSVQLRMSYSYSQHNSNLWDNDGVVLISYVSPLIESGPCLQGIANSNRTNSSAWIANPIQLLIPPSVACPLSSSSGYSTCSIRASLQHIRPVLFNTIDKVSYTARCYFDDFGVRSYVCPDGTTLVVQCNGSNAVFQATCPHRQQAAVCHAVQSTASLSTSVSCLTEQHSPTETICNCSFKKYANNANIDSNGYDQYIKLMLSSRLEYYAVPASVEMEEDSLNNRDSSYLHRSYSGYNRIWYCIPVVIIMIVLELTGVYALHSKDQQNDKSIRPELGNDASASASPLSLGASTGTVAHLLRAWEQEKGKEAVLMESSIPNIFRAQSLLSRLQWEVRKYHRWGSIAFPFPPSLQAASGYHCYAEAIRNEASRFRAYELAVLATTINGMASLLAVILSSYEELGLRCDSYISAESCTSSPMLMGVSVCKWSPGYRVGSCRAVFAHSEPNVMFNITFYCALIIVLFSIPLDWLNILYLQADSLEYSSENELDSVRVGQRQNKLVPEEVAKDIGLPSKLLSISKTEAFSESASVKQNLARLDSIIEEIEFDGEWDEFLAELVDCKESLSKSKGEEFLDKWGLSELLESDINDSQPKAQRASLDGRRSVASLLMPSSIVATLGADPIEVGVVANDTMQSKWKQRLASISPRVRSELKYIRSLLKSSVTYAEGDDSGSAKSSIGMEVQQHLMYLFYMDLLSNSNSFSKYLLKAKRVRDHFKPKSISLMLKLIVCFNLMLLNGALFFYLVRFGTTASSQTQLAWAISFFLWIIFDAFICSTGAVMLLHMGLPLVASAHIHLIKPYIAHICQQKSVGKEIDSGNSIFPKNMLLANPNDEFNSAKYYFVSYRVAQLFPNLDVARHIVERFATQYSRSTTAARIRSSCKELEKLSRSGLSMNHRQRAMQISRRDRHEYIEMMEYILSRSTANTKALVVALGRAFMKLPWLMQDLVAYMISNVIIGYTIRLNLWFYFHISPVLILVSMAFFAIFVYSLLKGSTTLQLTSTEPEVAHHSKIRETAEAAPTGQSTGVNSSSSTYLQSVQGKFERLKDSQRSNFSPRIMNVLESNLSSIECNSELPAATANLRTPMADLGSAPPDNPEQQTGSIFAEEGKDCNVDSEKDLSDPILMSSLDKRVHESSPLDLSPPAVESKPPEPALDPATWDRLMVKFGDSSSGGGPQLSSFQIECLRVALASTGAVPDMPPSTSTSLHVPATSSPAKDTKPRAHVEELPKLRPLPKDNLKMKAANDLLKHSPASKSESLATEAKKPAIAKLPIDRGASRNSPYKAMLNANSNDQIKEHPHKMVLLNSLASKQFQEQEANTLPQASGSKVLNERLQLACLEFAFQHLKEAKPDEMATSAKLKK